jgi:hypothetical protein
MRRDFYHGHATARGQRRNRSMRLQQLDGLGAFVACAAAAVAGAALLAGGGCAPETDLVSSSGAGSGAVAGGAAPGPGGGLLVDPAAGATEVPVNLAAVVVQFPGPVTLPIEALRVCAGGSSPVVVASIDPLPQPCDGGACFRAVLGGQLPPDASCRVELGSGGADASGQALPAGLIGVFDTASAADETPPLLTGITVAVMGPCIEVQFSTDEPASGAIVLRVGDQETVVPAGEGQMDYDVALPASLLPAATAATVSVRATDRAGNVAESEPLSLITPPAIPPIAITEVLANPAGPEPAQEYVELRNIGEADIDVAGAALAIQDSRGSDMLPAGTLVSGGYALVVTSAYDPSSGSDPAPRPGTLLLRVDTRIGADGLSNAGEVVRLVQGDTVVSSYGGWVDVSSSTWAGKSVHRLVQTACDRPDAWNRTPLPPTPGAGPP